MSRISPFYKRPQSSLPLPSMLLPSQAPSHLISIIDHIYSSYSFFSVVVSWSLSFYSNHQPSCAVFRRVVSGGPIALLTISRGHVVIHGGISLRSWSHFSSPRISRAEFRRSVLAGSLLPCLGACGQSISDNSPPLPWHQSSTPVTWCT